MYNEDLFDKTYEPRCRFAKEAILAMVASGTITLPRVAIGEIPLSRYKLFRA